MKIKETCIERTRNKKIVCEENKRKITFSNPQQIDVEKITIDGCQIEDGVKCDFLVRSNNSENFVELKGSDINHAFEQLSRTIKLLGKKTCKKRNSYVISSRSPLSAAEIQVLRIKFKKNFRSDLIVKNNSFQTDIKA